MPAANETRHCHPLYASHGRKGGRRPARRGCVDRDCPARSVGSWLSLLGAPPHVNCTWTISARAAPMTGHPINLDTVEEGRAQKFFFTVHTNSATTLTLP